MYELTFGPATETNAHKVPRRRIGQYADGLEAVLAAQRDLRYRLAGPCDASLGRFGKYGSYYQIQRLSSKGKIEKVWSAAADEERGLEWYPMS